MKKFLSILLAAMLVLGMVGGAVADDAVPANLSIKITEAATGYKYEAYQIFAGNVFTDSSTNPPTVTLSNVTWGANVTKDATESVTIGSNTYANIDELVAGLTPVTTDNTVTVKDTEGNETQKTIPALDVVTFSEYIKGELNATAPAGTSGEPEAKDGKQVYTIGNLKPGYYLVVNTQVATTGAFSKYIVQVLASDVAVTAKSDVPSVEKKVKDINDSDGTGETNWVDSADHDLNDTVKFRLKGTVADDVLDYKDEYFYAFHDTQSAGLTFNKESVEVFLNAENGAKIDSSLYTVKTDVEACSGHTFCIEFQDLKKVPNLTGESEIIVTYTSKLNENSVMGSAGNPNEVKLEFANNPYFIGEGKPTTSETPKDQVIVFTYNVVINKTNASQQPLAGAEFTLEKKTDANTWTPVAVVKSEAGTSFTFNRLDDGTYKLTETATPAGYNTIDPITFKVVAAHDDDDDNAPLTLVSLNGEPVTGEIEFTANKEAGSLTADVVNQSGATLPSTGGIGTTIFYLLGSIMFIGAAMTLVVRRRAEADEV